MESLQITKKEAVKVTHDINNVWHARYKGKRIATIVTHPNDIYSESYEYIFRNYGFNEYEFLGKYSSADRR